jgi:GNAT superfamily N-acetyltransferase
MIDKLVANNYPKTAALKDGTPLSIRPMDVSDCQRLWNFFRTMPEQDHLYLKHDVSRQETIENWCKHIDYGKVLPLLALKGDEIIADATLHQDRGGWLSHIGIVRIVVGPDYRGQGIGPRLLRELTEIATLSDLDILEAEFMAEQHRAIESFQRLGFQQFCVIPRRVRDRKLQYHDLVVLTFDLKLKRESLGAEEF